MENSLEWEGISIYQVIARVVSDLAVFAYLADVFVDENHRKKALGKFLMEKVMNFKDFQVFELHLNSMPKGSSQMVTDD